MVTRRSLVLVAALALVATLAAPAAADDRADAGGTEAPLVAGDGTEHHGSGPIERTRAIEVGDIGTAVSDSPDGTVRLDLFDDTSVLVDVAPVPSGMAGWDAWSGHVAGSPDSSVVLSTDGTRTAGLVTSPAGTFEIRPEPGDGHVALEVDPAAYPDSALDTVPGHLAPSASAAATPEAQPDSDPPADVPPYPVLDVLVGYTPEALAYAGDLGAMVSLIASALATTNSAYASAGVPGQLRLAGTYAIAERGIGPDRAGLSSVADADDGVADGLPGYGDALGADLIAVIGEQGSTSCGIGYLPGRVTVTNASCAVGNLGFAHEVGHNLSLHHDRFVSAAVGDPNPVFPYGYGYASPAGGWRTIMASNDVCVAAGTTCTRLARFSNPDQTYNGIELGRPWNRPDAADNRRVLAQTLWSSEELRGRVAPFRSWVAFVHRQNRDFRFGATVSGAQANGLSGQLATGAITPTAYIDLLVHGQFDDAYAPVARLYSAYFLRDPDISGLDYWANRLRRGTTLASVSQFFSTSAEFRELYGPLTHRQFVELIYENILGRPGEQSGIDFWTRQLTSGTRSRGWVMIGFSESAEYTQARLFDIETLLLYRGMLQRVPSHDEYAATAARRRAGLTLRRVILEVLGSNEYVPRAT